MKILAQIKVADTQRYRNHYAAKQEHRCPLCEGRLEKPCLDHCHKTGMLRATLCGTCNRNEGKVKLAIRYMSKLGHLTRTNPIRWLKNLVRYWEYHEANPSNIIHHSFDQAKGKQKPVKRAARKKKKA